MVSILQGQLADEVTAALDAADITYALTVSRTEVIGGSPFDPTSGETVITPYACRGWVDAYSLDEMNGTLIQESDVRVMIIVSSLTITPTAADTIAANGIEYAIIRVSRDPAGALYDVQART